MDVKDMARLGGKARWEGSTAGERKAAASAAIKARWDAYYKEHPDKLAEKKKREKAAK